MPSDALTASYPQLRGYQQLPFALGMLLQAAVMLGWRRQGDLTIFLPVFVAQCVGWVSSAATTTAALEWSSL